jgi:hypothetical protein
MDPGKPKTLRCATYTRKSSEEGLEQDFNSLHAQREACESFIRSQQGEGWQLVKTHYDDGGFSGGTIERPALQRLLEEDQTVVGESFLTSESRGARWFRRSRAITLKFIFVHEERLNSTGHPGTSSIAVCDSEATVPRHAWVRRDCMRRDFIARSALVQLVSGFPKVAADAIPARGGR